MGNGPLLAGSMVVVERPELKKLIALREFQNLEKKGRP